MEVLAKDKVKMVFVGDPSVGKTCLIKTYVEKKFPDNVPVSLYDVYEAKCTVGQSQVSLEINDTAGQYDMQHVRQIAFNGCDVCVVCFSMNSRNTLNSVPVQWIDEITSGVGKSIPRILVGCKSDDKIISDSEIEDVRESYGFLYAVQCSAQL